MNINLCTPLLAPLPTGWLKIFNELYLYLICDYLFSCSSADEDNEDPSTKAHREKERRQANNVRER